MKRKEETYSLSIRVNFEFLDKLDREASDLLMSRTQFMKHALEMFINYLEKERSPLCSRTLREKYLKQ